MLFYFLFLEISEMGKGRSGVTNTKLMRDKGKIRVCGVDFDRIGEE